MEILADMTEKVNNEYIREAAVNTLAELEQSENDIVK